MNQYFNSSYILVQITSYAFLVRVRLPKITTVSLRMKVRLQVLTFLGLSDFRVTGRREYYFYIINCYIFIPGP